MHLDRATFADGVYPLVGLSLDVDAAGLDGEDAGEVGADGVLVGREFRAFEDDGGIEVFEAPAEGGGAVGGGAQEDLGVLGLVARVGVGEELADVGEGKGAEDGVGDGVVEGVTIGVGDGAGVVGEGDSPEDERAAPAGGRVGLEAVEVVAVADAELAHRCEFTRVVWGGFRALH